MSKQLLNEKIITALCKDYEALWLIDCEEMSINIYSDNTEVRIPKSVETASALKSYESARLWYIENYVSLNDKKRLEKLTAVDNILKNTVDNNQYTIEYNRLCGGKINYNQLTYSRIYDEEASRTYILMGFRNIDIRKKVEIDDLTGLYTRSAFFAKAEKLVRNNPDKKFDILISDIVDFKKINETYGISKADDILTWMGAYLAPLITDEIIIGRYGGDQFVTVGPHEFMAFNASADALQSFYDAKDNNGLPPISVKFGYYEDFPHDKSIVSSCDKAHLALNSVKNHYEQFIAFYTDELRHELEVRRKIENSMHQALANEDFKVYYQPKHDARTNKLVGAEALIRWISPEHGFMSPGEFIPLFENNGFVVETDNFVWAKTCKNLQRWKEMGLKTVPVSVNASKLTLSQKDIMDKIQNPVKAYGISPEQMHIEVTETLMYEDNDELIQTLKQIQKLGHKIELDDFGTGYSSINILSTLPLDVVKLDMSFMRHFGDEKKTKILIACIALAKDLGYKTISEGVEEQIQRDALEKYGVDFIQGYYYSKPLSEEDFEKYLKAQQN